MTNQHDAATVADEPEYSEGDKRERNQYLREFIPPMASYGVILALVLTFVDQESDSAKYWMLLPVLPMLGVGVAVFRSIQRADEYSRQLQVESMAMGFGAATLASLIFGFLGVAGVALTWSPWIIFAAAMVTWGVSLGIRGGTE